MTTHTTQPSNVDVVVIGAGQTGLATAALLSRAGATCIVLEEGARVGDQWRRRYDSLRLNTPAKYDALPGMPFPAPANSWPTGSDMGDYLEAYAQAMALDVRCATHVLRIEPTGDGGWSVTCGGGRRFTARNVVVATGGEHHPKRPDVAEQLEPGIRQLHSSGYHNPSQLLPGPVLVVGASQSGADLALESAQSGHETWLSGRVKAEIPVDITSPQARVVGPVLWFLANHVLTTRTPSDAG